VSINERKTGKNDESFCGAARVYYVAGHVTVTVTVLTLMP